MSTIKAWIHAMRLRTLPLAFSSIIAGSTVALLNEHFNTTIFILALFTTLCLQILSNLANDYGDFVNGVDNDERVGPERALQSGIISKSAMVKGLVISATLAFISGLALISYSFGLENKFFLLFLFLGIAAIAAAIKYTVGKKPYGYLGLGDVFVFLFFGLVGVGGSFFLYNATFDPLVLLPAITIGCLSMAVLNLNNMRDQEADAKVGKMTLAVKLGKKYGILYHVCIVALALGAALVFSIATYSNFVSFLPMVVAVPLILNIKKVVGYSEPKSLDPELKKVALSTFLYSLLLLMTTFFSMKFTIAPHTLHFKFAAGTSRGVMHKHHVWYLKLEENGKIGFGEIAPLPGLSHEWNESFESQLPQRIAAGLADLKSVAAFPSIAMGLHTALKSLENKDPFTIFDTPFSNGLEPIIINGLIWMNDKKTMLEHIDAKIQAGFSCIKLKIGAIDFDDEIALIKHIRQHFDAKTIEIRVDANGAFSPQSALEKLNVLAELQLHSIEQPIKAGQWEEMALLCSLSPLPIALDEELIGIIDDTQKRGLLQQIRPKYIILKPSLLGDFDACNQWISMAKEEGIGWWATSALESNIGLNAIAQWVSTYELAMPQGLGTGQLYHNNIDSPLQIENGFLKYDLKSAWKFEKF